MAAHSAGTMLQYFAFEQHKLDTPVKYDALSGTDDTVDIQGALLDRGGTSV